MRRTIRILTLAMVLCFALTALAMTASAAEFTSEEAMDYLDSYSDNVASDPDFDANVASSTPKVREFTSTVGAMRLTVPWNVSPS